MAKAKKMVGGKVRNDSLPVRKEPGETEALSTARVVMESNFRHGLTVAQVLKVPFGSADFTVGIGDYADAIAEKAAAAQKGDLRFASRMLAAQAVTLDTIFGEMARRMALNMGDYLGATETYGRIAMKAQAQSRAALETLAKLHQPREQTVRHVHVNEGGQAVIADQFHHHPGTERNGESLKQSDATGPAGQSAALPSPDPFGNGVPIPGSARQEAMQDARGDQSGGA
jgi:hypothetical protein